MTQGTPTAGSGAGEDTAPLFAGHGSGSIVRTPVDRVRPWSPPPHLTQLHNRIGMLYERGGRPRPAAIARALGVSPGVVERALLQPERSSPLMLERVMTRLGATERELGEIAALRQLSETVTSEPAVRQQPAPSVLPGRPNPSTTRPDVARQILETRLPPHWAAITTEKQFMTEVRALRAKVGISLRDISLGMQRINAKLAWGKTTVNDLLRKDTMPKDRDRLRLMLYVLIQADTTNKAAHTDVEMLMLVRDNIVEGAARITPAVPAGDAGDGPEPDRHQDVAAFLEALKEHGVVAIRKPRARKPLRAYLPTFRDALFMFWVGVLLAVAVAVAIVVYHQETLVSDGGGNHHAPPTTISNSGAVGGGSWGSWSAATRQTPR